MASRIKLTAAKRNGNYLPRVTHRRPGPRPV